MVDVTVTAANVQAAAGATIRQGTAGAAITAGMAIRKNTSNLMVGSEHDNTVVEAACDGIALNDAANGQPVTYVEKGGVDVGATLTVGETYVVGTGVGGISPIADIGAGDFATILGVATAADNLDLDIKAGGTARA